MRTLTKPPNADYSQETYVRRRISLIFSSKVYIDALYEGKLGILIYTLHKLKVFLFTAFEKLQQGATVKELDNFIDELYKPKVHEGVFSLEPDEVQDEPRDLVIFGELLVYFQNILLIIICKSLSN